MTARGRAASGIRWIRRHAWIGLVAALILGPPLWFMVAHVPYADWEQLSGPSLPRRLDLLLTTARQALWSMLWAAVLGFVVAAGIQAAPGWRRWALSILYPLPLLLSPLVLAFAWTKLLGKRGVAQEWWCALTGAHELPFSIYGEAGAGFVLATHLYPLTAMAALAALQSFPRALWDAGRTLAPPGTVFRRVALPLLEPFLWAGMVFIAWRSLADTETSFVFLRPSYALELYAAMQINPSTADLAALGLPLLLLGLLVWAARGAFRADPPEQQAGAHAHEVGLPLAPRWLWETLAWAIIGVAVVLPMATLIWQCGAWQAVREALATAREEIRTSFWVAGLAATLCLLAAWPWSAWVHELRGNQRKLAVLVTLLPAALPGLVHGIAWQQMLLGSAWSRWWLDQANVLPVCHAAMFFPFAVLFLCAGREALPPGYGEAARSLGAGAWRRFYALELPLLAPAALFSAALVFAFSLGEISAALRLAPPGQGTLPVRISSLLHFNQDHLVAALCLWQTGLALIPYALALVWLPGRWTARLG